MDMLPNTCGIYEILNVVTQHRYIGYTSNLRKRRNQHFFSLEHGLHQNRYLQSSWNKYGKYNFKYNIIQFCSRDKLAYYEDYWVKILKTEDHYYGFNIQSTDPNNIFIVSEETKQKLRIVNKGKRPSDLCFKNRRLIPMSKEHRIRIGKLTSERKSKKVMNILTGQLYKSVRLLSKELLVTESTLSYHLLQKSRVNKFPIYKYI